MARHGLFRRRWLLLRWLGLRWERRLAWFVLVLFGAGPVIASATLLWYVRSGRLAQAFEGQLAGVLGAPVKVEGLQVKGWHRYAVPRFTLLGGPEASRPLLRADEGTVTTGQRTLATFLKGTVDIGDDAALAAWRQVLLGPTTGGQSEPSLELDFKNVYLAGGVPGVRLPPRAEVTLKSFITITPQGRSINLFGQDASRNLLAVGASSDPSGLFFSFMPPGLLGRERLATILCWPPALIPTDLDGYLMLFRSPGSLVLWLNGSGNLDLGDVAQALGLPQCSGKVTLTIEKLDLKSGVDAGRSRGELSIALAGSGPATVDPLALEVFRYIFFGQLSDRAVEEDVYTLDRIAFTVTLAGDRVTVTGEDGPLLSGRSQRGYTIELTGPAQATTEELARRLRLALGGLPARPSAAAGEGPAAPSTPGSP
jgi:hypothetical protein